jgi:hypothetical protein
MVLILILLAAAAASAQVRIVPSSRPDGPTTINVTLETRAPNAITGLPYSGDRTSERILSDGTRMSQSTVRQFRDSFGRLREEQSGPLFGSLTIVQILDPVAGVEWVLDPANQVAHRMVLQVKSRAGSQSLKPCDSGGPPTTEKMPNGNMMTSQPLGSQTIQGIAACGHRNTIIQKDGTPGLTTENWLSREDIGSILLLKDSNPQSGQNITQLVNLKFSEPDPGLFVPPANYRVVDETEAFTFTEPAPASQTSQHQPAPATRTIVALTGMPWSGDLMSGSTLIGTNSRDSMGRTRSNVTIVDPVAGYSYILDTPAHIARRRNITAKSKPASEAPTPAEAGSHTTKLASGVIGLTESLGTKTIDGVVTFGTRTTLTYPPGTASGNDKTTSSVNESWTSPQLGTVVLMQHSGALGPEFTTTLTNLKYSEPDPSLFKVPDGYQIIDEH